MIENMIGKKYGRLTVLDQYYKKTDYDNRDYCWCECECGNKKEIMGKNIRSGLIVSCRCYQSEQLNDANREYNQYNIDGEYGIGYTKKGEEFYFDLEDFSKIKEYCWALTEWNYVYSRSFGESCFMHDLIMNNTSEEIVIDHENRIRYDNRKFNLRYASDPENHWNKETPKNNKSGVMGVSITKEGSWDVYLGKNGKRVFRKKFKNFEDAVKARLLAEKEHYGEFSPQKHLFKQYGIE
jgi:hypothetical protein